MENQLTEPKFFKFNEIKINQEASFQIKITEQMINEFAKISGDHNPLHTDQKFAKNSKFGKRICHGMLLGSFISQLLGMHLPGTNCLYLSQNLEFENPCYINDVILIKGIVIRKSESTKIIEISTVITNQNNLVLVNGTAKVIVSE